MKQKKLSLPVQIFIALMAGIVVGLICYFTNTADFTAKYLKPFGTIFVNLLKFIVVPVVLFSMIDGIISMGDMKKVGSVGWKTVAYFLATTAIACVIGLVFANIFNGAGLFPQGMALEEGQVWEGASSANFMDTLVGIFPSNMWQSFSNANMLQVIVIALFFGGSILAAGEKAMLCRDIVSSFYSVIEKLMGFVISLSPIGVFTMMAWVVATQGAEILGSLALVLLCAYIGYIVHAVLVYSLSAKLFANINPITFFKKSAAAMIFAFTSASSVATLPVSKECADKMGAENVVFTAQFKKESALAAPVLDWNAATEFPVGVSYSAKPKVSCEAAVKIVKVTGLPAGLSYKSGKVSGAPTAAKTYTVSVTVALATNAKKTWALKQKLVVGALPAWAKGTYVGGSEKMQATLTVGSTGKASGKLNFANAVWTLSGTKISKLDPKARTATLSLTAKKGSAKKTVAVTLGEDELGGFAFSETKGFEFEARQGLWTSDALWKSCAAALVGAAYADPKGDLTVTFGANGKATAKLKSGRNTFSASAVLCPTEIGETAVTGKLYLYFAPNTKKKFKGAVRIVDIESAGN